MAGILQTADYTQFPEHEKPVQMHHNDKLPPSQLSPIESSILNLQDQLISKFPRQDLLSALDPSSPLISYFTTMLNSNFNTFPNIYDDIPNDESVTKYQAGGEAQILNLADHIPGASDWPDLDKLCDLNIPISELFPENDEIYENETENQHENRHEIANDERPENQPDNFFEHVIESPNNTVLSTPVMHRKISTSRNSRKSSLSEFRSEYQTNNLETPSKLALVSSPESQPSPYLSHPSQIQQHQASHQQFLHHNIENHQSFKNLQHEQFRQKHPDIVEHKSAPENTKFFRKKYQSEMGINEFSNFNRNPNYQYFADESNNGGNSSTGGTGTVKKRKSFLQKVRNIFTKKRNTEHSSESIKRELSKSQQIFTNTEDVSPEIKKGGRYSSFRSIGKKKKGSKSDKRNFDHFRANHEFPNQYQSQSQNHTQNHSQKNSQHQQQNQHYYQNQHQKQLHHELGKKYKSQNFEPNLQSEPRRSNTQNHGNTNYQHSQPAQFIHHGSMPAIAHQGYSPRNSERNSERHSETNSKSNKLRHPMHENISKGEASMPLARQAFGKYNFRTYTDDIEKIPISGLSPAVKIENPFETDVMNVRSEVLITSDVMKSDVMNTPSKTGKTRKDPGFLYHSNIMSPPSPFTNPYNNEN